MRRATPSAEEPVSELRRIPIQENGEPLVDFVELCAAILWAERHPVFEYQRQRLLRKGVAERLARAVELLPPGIRLVVVEGWRAPAIQEHMHADTRRRLRAEHPDWAERALSRMVNRFSAPMDRRVPPPHTTGGAMDLHLADERGEVLDFTSPYGILDPRGAPAAARGLSPEAARNRAILRQALETAGITNYPAEWWHWSYGDQAWAYRGGHPHAFYGAAEVAGLDSDFSFRRLDNPGLQ